MHLEPPLSYQLRPSQPSCSRRSHSSPQARNYDPSREPATRAFWPGNVGCERGGLLCPRDFVDAGGGLLEAMSCEPLRYTPDSSTNARDNSYDTAETACGSGHIQEESVTTATPTGQSARVSAGSSPRLATQAGHRGGSPVPLNTEGEPPHSSLSTTDLSSENSPFKTSTYPADLLIRLVQKSSFPGVHLHSATTW